MVDLGRLLDLGRVLLRLEGLDREEDSARRSNVSSKSRLSNKIQPIVQEESDMLERKIAIYKNNLYGTLQERGNAIEKKDLFVFIVDFEVDDRCL